MGVSAYSRQTVTIASIFVCMLLMTFFSAQVFGSDATFKLRIEANPKSGGTVSPAGTIEYDAGTKAEITATANEGYVFTGWSGASTDKAKSITVTINSNQTLTANFEKPAMLEDSRDGKTYRTVRIGKNNWMAENLNYEADNSWCYDNNTSNCDIYGRLYDWNTAMKACPSGWRLSTLEDWDDLCQAVGGVVNPFFGKGRNKDNIRHVYNMGTKLKSNSGWNNRPNGSSGNGTDDFGFSALPGGIGDNGSFGYWWTATEYRDRKRSGAYLRFITNYDWVDVGQILHDQKQKPGFSVRCVQE